MDSSKFDLRTMNSGAISISAPCDLSKSLAVYVGDLIMSLPQEDSIEVKLRSVLDILVISKLQSVTDRSELEVAKKLIISGHDSILSAREYNYGTCSVLNLKHWTILNLALDNQTSLTCLSDYISEAIHNITSGKHLIFDLSQVSKIDLKFAAFLIGLQDMLGKSGKQMSLAWLPKEAVNTVSANIYNSLIAKFKLYKKGLFLLSGGAV